MVVVLILWDIQISLYKSILSTMGNHESQQQHFIQSNWRQTSSSFSEVVQYQSISDKNTHIEKYQIQSVSKEEYQKIKQISMLRKNNPYWVSSLYFQDKQSEEQQFCSYKYEGQLYLQKIPIRLCDLRNIPFPDAIHLYHQSLHGFSQFAKYMGCFPVESDYIGINERGVVKVWAGAKWSTVTVRGAMISQEDMVRTLVQCLEEAIDKNSMPTHNPSIRNFLYRTSDRVNFDQAMNELRAFANITNMGNIPSRLNSIEDNPDRYDTQRLRTEHKHYPSQNHIHFLNPQSHTHFPPQSQSQFSNHYSPRFSLKPNSIQQQITTFKRVESVQNEVISKQAPISQFAREGRSSSNYQVVVSQPNYVQENSNYLLKPSSSLRHLSSAGYSANSLRNQQIVYQRLAVEPNQQNNLVTYQQNQGPIDRNRSISYRRQQSIKPSVTFRQQQVTSYLPYQTQTRNNFVQYQQQVPQRQIFAPQNVQANQNNPQGQSIIMKLGVSQDNKVFNPNAPIGQTKQFGLVKRVQSLHVDFPKKFDSSTIINENQPNSMIGIPTGQLQKISPFGIHKYQPFNLNSIEQVNTEHYWKESANNHPPNKQSAPQPFSLTYIKEHKDKKPSQIVLKNNYNTIDENDGKSSDDFLKRLKEISTGASTNFESNSNNFDYGHSVDKKKQVIFANESNRRPNKQQLFGRSAQSKQQNYLNDYYDGKLFTTKAYEGQIDPDIWADMQKYKR